MLLRELKQIMKCKMSSRRNHPAEGDKDVRTRRVTAAIALRSSLRMTINLNHKMPQLQNQKAVVGVLRKAAKWQCDDPLRAVKIAMENRVAMKECLPKRLATYPCAIEEFANLQFHQKLIEHNQTLLEGPPPAMIPQLPPFKTELEPVLESKEGKNIIPPMKWTLP